MALPAAWVPVGGGEIRYAGGNKPWPVGTNARGQTVYSDGSTGWTKWQQTRKGDTMSGGAGGSGGYRLPPSTTSSGTPSSSNYQAPEPFDVEGFLNKLKDEIAHANDKYYARAKEFDVNHPFVFDEAQAKASAEERYNPYYNAELSDFLKGIETQRSTTQGERTLLTDLNRIQATQDQTKLTETIRASEEGYAGSGLFFSGAKSRDTGLANIAGNQQTEKRVGTYNQNMLANTNRLSDLLTTEGTGRRTNFAARTTDIQSDIERQRAEEKARRETERQQYIGFPGTSLTSGFTNTLMSAFQ